MRDRERVKPALPGPPAPPASPAQTARPAPAAMAEIVSLSGGRLGSQELDNRYAFVGRLDKVKIVAQLLKSINFRESSTWTISQNGLKVTVEDAKCVQANAFVKAEIFEDFFLKPSAEAEAEDEEGSGDLSFAVNLSVVLECLQMLSGDQASHTVKLCYLGFGHSLEILMEEDGVISDSQIKTSEADENLDFNFANAKIVSKIIMHSSYLKEVFSELDNSSDHIEFIINPSDETFRVRTIGPAGECEISVPSSSDMVEHFNSSNVSKARFNLSLLRNGLKPLAFSDKVSIRMDEREFLCLQYMVNTDSVPTFLEFYCAPEEDIV